MADFAPPPGPPPPKVPEGWKAVWNAQYSEWFYVNIYTKQSQWEKPTSPTYPPGEAPPDGPPPYSGSGAPSTSDTKNLSSNNPFGSATGKSPQPDISEDEKLARRLQEEEEARARGEHTAGSRGAADDFYNQPQQNAYAGAPGYTQQSYPPQQPQSPYGGVVDQSSTAKSKKGLFSSLLGGKSSKPAYQQQGYPPNQQAYGQPYGQPYGQQAGGYGGYPQQGGGMMGGGRKKPGLGGAGAAALGVGGGLLAGGLIGEAMADAGDHGGDYGGDGGDYGGDGGDFGGDGGDFGGDF